MAETRYYLPARYYTLLCGKLAEFGVDVPTLLRDARIDPLVLQAPDGELTPEQVDRLTQLGAQRAGRSDLGFELGRQIKLSSHDILGYAMLSSPTLDVALRLVARYFSLITPTYQMQYRSDARQVSATVLPALPLSQPVLMFHQETIAVAYYETVRSLLAGDLPGCSIYLSLEPPPHQARYRELRHATVHFGQTALPGARIVLDKSTAERTLSLGDSNTLKMAETRCAELLQRIVNRSSLRDWATMMLREAAHDQPTLEELARILNLSPRTLERRLSTQDVGFRDLARRARHDAACRLLDAGRLNITQVAHQLGYTDAANFTRAFRRDAGMAPRQYLAQRRPPS